MTSYPHVRERKNPSNRPDHLTDWWSVRGSNSRPPPCHGGALPAELTPQSCAKRKIKDSHFAPSCQDKKQKPHRIESLAKSLQKEMRFCLVYSHWKRKGISAIPRNKNKKPQYISIEALVSLASPSRFERLTYCLGGNCSIQLSYGDKPPYFRRRRMKLKLT